MPAESGPVWSVPAAAVPLTAMAPAMAAAWHRYVTATEAARGVHDAQLADAHDRYQQVVAAAYERHHGDLAQALDDYAEALVEAGRAYRDRTDAAARERRAEIDRAVSSGRQMAPLRPLPPPPPAGDDGQAADVGRHEHSALFERGPVA